MFPILERIKNNGFEARMLDRDTQCAAAVSSQAVSCGLGMWRIYHNAFTKIS